MCLRAGGQRSGLTATFFFKSISKKKVIGTKIKLFTAKVLPRPYDTKYFELFRKMAKNRSGDRAEYGREMSLKHSVADVRGRGTICLLYTSPSPRD